MKSRSARGAAVVLSLAILAGCGTGGGEDIVDTTTPKTTTTVDATTTEADDLGGVDDEALDAWAVSFCESFEDRWLAELKSLSDNADADVTPGDIESIKASFVGLFRGSADATATLVSDVEALGAPDATNGEEIHAEMVRLFGDVEDTLTGVADEMETLSTDDPEFQAKTMDLVDEFSAAADEIQGSFEDIDAEYPSPELGLAISSHCSL